MRERAKRFLQRICGKHVAPERCANALGSREYLEFGLCGQPPDTPLTFVFACLYGSSESTGLLSREREMVHLLAGLAAILVAQEFTDTKPIEVDLPEGGRHVRSIRLAEPLKIPLEFRATCEAADIRIHIQRYGKGTTPEILPAGPASEGRQNPHYDNAVEGKRVRIAAHGTLAAGEYQVIVRAANPQANAGTVSIQLLTPVFPGTKCPDPFFEGNSEVDVNLTEGTKDIRRLSLSKQTPKVEFEVSCEAAELTVQLQRLGRSGIEPMAARPNGSGAMHRDIPYAVVGKKVRIATINPLPAGEYRLSFRALDEAAVAGVCKVKLVSPQLEASGGSSTVPSTKASEKSTETRLTEAEGKIRVLEKRIESLENASKQKQ
jgi:hypothetical protein